MPRDRKGITRSSGRQRKDPVTFYVIASEGTETEPAYFEYVSILLSRLSIGRLIKVEPLRRSDSDSSFIRVIKQLDDYKRMYSLKAGDELWCLIDRDNIPIKNAAQAAKLCSQKNYEFCLSTPCFELWLLLHFKDLSAFTADELNGFLENKKRIASRTVLEHALNEEIKTVLGKSYSKSSLPPELLEYLPVAMQRAFSGRLDSNHWTFTALCTRVHVLVQRIFNAEPPDYKIPKV